MDVLGLGEYILYIYYIKFNKKYRDGIGVKNVFYNYKICLYLLFLWLVIIYFDYE